MAERPLADRWETLRSKGLLAADAFPDRTAELATVRAVARDGLGAARVFDGHRNALERLTRRRAGDVDDALRAQLAGGEHAIGVWGADPGPGDGTPAVLSTDGRTVSGVKTFCSGSGHVDFAIVLVRRAADAPPILPVLVDLRDPARVHVDRDWFTSPALTESHSHRVAFDGAAVVAVLGTEGTLTQEPWFSGDALRSSGVWAGAADTILRRMTERSGGPGDDERIGRAAAIVAGVGVWLAAGLRAVEDEHAGGMPAWDLVAAMRLELTERLRELLRLAAEHGGSRGLVHDPELQEARDGLDLLLLQHRLAPTARKLGDRRLAVGIPA